VVVGLRAVVIVGHHAFLCCRFWKPPHAGEVLLKFLTNTKLLPFCAGEEPVRGDPGDPDRLRQRRGSACTVPPRHCLDSPLPR
jgi:hypothetical protein